MVADTTYTLAPVERFRRSQRFGLTAGFDAAVLVASLPLLAAP
jgi:hypothetical protein